jgi:hypothetical protein
MRIGARGEFGFEASVGLAVIESGDANQAFGFRLSVNEEPIRSCLADSRFEEGIRK